MCVLFHIISYLKTQFFFFSQTTFNEKFVSLAFLSLLYYLFLQQLTIYLSYDIIYTETEGFPLESPELCLFEAIFKSYFSEIETQR